MVVAYASKPLEYIEYPKREESGSEQSRRNGLDENNWCSTTKIEQKIATETVGSKMPRSAGYKWLWITCQTI